MKKVIILLCLAYLNIPLASAQSELSFNRLFSTPAQRANLDSSRQRLIQGLDTPEQIDAEEIQEDRIAKATTLQELLLPRAKYNGLIIRESGRADYWVNGKSTREKTELGKELKSHTHRHGKRITIDVAENERIHLYPGQVFSFERDRKFEGYQDPHKDEGKAIEKPTIKEELAAGPSTVQELQAKPTEVFDESFLIKEIQKIQLLEKRLLELEGSKIQP